MDLMRLILEYINRKTSELESKVKSFLIDCVATIYSTIVVIVCIFSLVGAYFLFGLIGTLLYICVLGILVSFANSIDF